MIVEVGSSSVEVIDKTRGFEHRQVTFEAKVTHMAIVKEPEFAEAIEASDADQQLQNSQ